jgi:hypothetical protein
MKPDLLKLVSSEQLWPVQFSSSRTDLQMVLFDHSGYAISMVDDGKHYGLARTGVTFGDIYDRICVIPDELEDIMAQLRPASDPELYVCPNPVCEYPFSHNQTQSTCNSCEWPIRENLVDFQYLIDCDIHMIVTNAPYVNLIQMLRLHMEGLICANFNTTYDARNFTIRLGWECGDIFQTGGTRFRGASNLEILERYCRSPFENCMYSASYWTGIRWFDGEVIGLNAFIKEYGAKLVENPNKALDEKAAQRHREAFLSRSYADSSTVIQRCLKSGLRINSTPESESEVIIEALYPVYMELAQRHNLYPVISSTGNINWNEERMYERDVRLEAKELFGKWGVHPEALETMFT